MATKFRFIYNGVTSDFDDYYVRTDLFNQEQIWSFGSNNLGQLGDNTITHRSSPVQEITFGVNWKQISVGTFSSGIKTDGTLWTWGANTFGQLGDNTTTHRSSAVQTISTASNWYNVCVGYQHNLAVKNDGTLWAWGRNSYGQLGNNTVTHRSSPTQTVDFSQTWSQVSGGYQHSAAVKNDGTLWTFGRNNFGQLGVGTGLVHRSSPTQVIGFNLNWSVVSTSGSHTCGIKTDGTAWCWGLNTSGQLGDGTTTTKSSPVQVINWASWTYADQGYFASVGVKTDGTLWAWGYNFNGEVGDNSITSRNSPVQTVAFGNNWLMASISGAFQNNNVAAVKTDGTLWCWGSNTNGKLGDNTTVSKSSPVQVVGFATTWSSVSVLGDSAVAIKKDGTLWTWGC